MRMEELHGPYLESLPLALLQERLTLDDIIGPFAQSGLCLTRVVSSFQHTKHARTLTPPSAPGSPRVFAG